MHSSADELLLLLNKWTSESTRLRLVASFSPPTGFAAVLRMTGFIRLEVETATFTVYSEDESVFMCHLGPAGFGYATPSGVDAEDLAKLVDNADEVEDLAIIRGAAGSTIALFSLKH